MASDPNEKLAASFHVTRMDNGKSVLIHTASIRNIVLVPRGGTCPVESSTINFHDARQPLQVKEAPAALKVLMSAEHEAELKAQAEKDKAAKDKIAAEKKAADDKRAADQKEQDAKVEKDKALPNV